MPRKLVDKPEIEKQGETNAPQKLAPKLVKMVHVDSGKKADVHPDEVSNYKGYRVEK